MCHSGLVTRTPRVGRRWPKRTAGRCCRCSPPEPASWRPEVSRGLGGDHFPAGAGRLAGAGVAVAIIDISEHWETKIAALCAQRIGSARAEAFRPLPVLGRLPATRAL